MSETIGLLYPGAVIVTGASGGVGYQVATQLLEKGVRNLVLVYRTDGKLLEELCKKYDLKAADVLYQADLTREQEVAAFGQWLTQRHPKVWALLNIAGGSTNGMHWKLSLKEFQDVIGMNLISTFLMTKTISPVLRNQGFGRIINFSSVVGQSGLAGASHYVAAKCAIEGFTRATALELAKKNILVNALALGYFEYGLIKDVPEPILSTIIDGIPIHRLGTIQDLFPSIEYLINPTQTYVTGQVLQVSGGMRM